ncbi:unnamed protein product [Cutaneotrichosporon oleaginosum]
MANDAERRMMEMLARDQMARDSRDRGPVPRPGSNDDFDEYVLETFGSFDPDSGVDMGELRKAAWRTWRTAGPSIAAPSRSSQAEEDAELARAIALSAKEFKEAQGSETQPIVIDSDDDDDDGLQRAHAAPVEERPAKRRREETPDEERKALAAAIAASLPNEPLDDDSDAEMERANAAYQASRAASRERQIREREAKRAATVGPSSKAPSTTTSSARPSPQPKEEADKPVAGGLQALGIDRAQLERERLARQAMRSGSRSVQTPAGQQADAPRGPRPTQRTGTARLSNHPLQSMGPFPTDDAGEYYLDGELRHVRLQIGSSTTERTFSPQDVFGKIVLVIVSAYCWDPDWIETFMPRPDLCPTIRILRPPVNDQFERRRMAGKLRPLENGEVQVYPNMDGKMGSEHMKFAWIWFKTGRLRVSIMTANMVDYDWELIENTVFIQDFLPKGQTLGSTTAPDPALPDFPDQFRHLFAHFKVYKALKWQIERHPRGKCIPISDSAHFEDFKKYDWSRVQVRLVMSIAGTHTGFKEMSKYGICRLGKILAEEGWHPRKDEKVVAEYQGSSLGKYSLDWYSYFYQLCNGKDLASIARSGKAVTWPPLKVVFPSLATVDTSINGRPGGGTMFCGSAFSDRTRSLFHDANSKRGGVLMHTKMLIALFEPSSSGLGFSTAATNLGKRKADDIVTENEGVGGWVYVGSHNFSPSAWGTLNFKNSPPTLNINNFELGIVFPLPRGRGEIMANEIAAHKRPPRPYGKSDEPWDQKKYLPNL